MVEIQPTNVCCFDLQQDCVDYLKSLGLYVYEGSLGSSFTIDWGNTGRHISVPVLIDTSYPRNFQEYHVFIHDMSIVNERNYNLNEHNINRRVEDASQEYLECSPPITLYDLRPYGSHLMKKLFDLFGEDHKFISIVFASEFHSVEYHSNEVGYNIHKNVGKCGNFEAWALVDGKAQYGKRVRLVEGVKFSAVLFSEHLNETEYFRTFRHPANWVDGKFVPIDSFYPLLNDESGNCISYIYMHKDSGRIDFVLPQVKDKAKLLKVLFENLLFECFSEFFPDFEARKWIHNITYELPNEVIIRKKIEARKEDYEEEMKKLEADSESVRASNKHLKDMLVTSGEELVKAVKVFLEYLGFENVIDKDSTLKEGEIREEDLAFSCNGTNILMEVKGINGTSTDSECSQIDKVVLRRIRETKDANYHGIYVVNNQRNVEPLKRQVPPFNKIQVKDAENQGRTMAYTAQLFALFSDIENRYVRKESVRQRLMMPGLFDPHGDLISLGVPAKFYENQTVICFHLKDALIRKGDYVFYLDELQRMVGAEVQEIHLDGKSVESASSGDVSIKVSKSFPRSGEVFIKKEEQFSL